MIQRALASGEFFNLYTQFVSDAPVWRLVPDRDRMASLNIDFGTAMDVLGTLNGGSFVNQTYESGQYRQVYVQAEGDRRSIVQDLNNLYVPTVSGQQVPLANVIQVKLDSAPPIISHYDLYRTVLIQGLRAWARAVARRLMPC